MKKLTILLAILALSATTAFGQADLGDIGVFADQAGTQTTATPPPFDANQVLYVVIFGTDVAAWEASLSFDAFITPISATFNPANSVNVGSFPSFIVGTGTCVLQNAGAAWVMCHTYGLFSGQSSNDLKICVGGASPSTFGGPPGYQDCNNNLVPSGLAQNGGSAYPNGCMVLHPQSDPPVGTGETSFGSVKGRF